MAINYTILIFSFMTEPKRDKAVSSHKTDVMRADIKTASGIRWRLHHVCIQGLAVRVNECFLQ